MPQLDLDTDDFSAPVPSLAPAPTDNATHRPTLLANVAPAAAPETPKASANPFAHPADIGHMLANTPPPLDYVLPGLLAGTVGLMVGPGGVSKTMLALQIGVAVATGTALFGGLVGPADGKPQQPARVVLVLAEETGLIVWHRLYAVTCAQLEPLGLDMGRAYWLLQRNLVIHALGSRQQVSLLDHDYERTYAGEQLRSACDGARLVVLDPIRNFHNEDENDSGAMSALMHHVASYAASTGAAWLLTHHTSRAAGVQDYGASADAGRGSTALTNAARWQLNLSCPSRKSAKLYGLSEDQMGNYVLLDVPKANYMAPMRTMVLARDNCGVLSLVGSST